MKAIRKVFATILAAFLAIQTVLGVAFASFPTATDDKPAETGSGIVVGAPDDYSTDSLDPKTIKTIGEGELTLEELSKINIDDVVFPECISQENAKSREHVNRLCSQEKNLNTVVFQNRDGSKTAYIFTKPVKYLDQDNLIKDKSTLISASSNDIFSFAMENNNVQVFFPDDISKGVMLRYNGYSLGMRPLASDNSDHSGLCKISDNQLIYCNAYDSHTDLKYTTLFSGIKEDIVINEYTGQTRFCFLLHAERLSTQQTENGIWRLINEKGRPVFNFDSIYICDSKGKSTFGVITVEPGEINSFVVYIDVPIDFLTDPTTQYPVFVDPTITVNETISVETENGSVEQSAIIDVGIFASYDDYCAANGSTVLNMGIYDEDICKIIYKFPVFYNDDISPFFELNRYRIGSAVLNINYLSSTSVTVVANPMTDTYSDTIDPTHLYDPALIDAFSSVNSSSTSFSSSGLKQIGITDIVKGWADFLSGETTAAYCDPQNGLLLSLSNSNAFISVASTEYSSAQNNVYLTIDYSDVGGKYYLYNLSEYKLLCNDSSNTLSLNTYSASNTRKWSLEYLGNDKFYIRSVNNPNYVLYGNGSSVYLQQFPSTQSERNKCKWVILTATGGGVIIKNDYSDNYLHINGTSLNLISPPASGTNAYDLCRWGILETKKYNGITNLSLSDDWIKPGTSKYLNIKATPANASWKSAHFFTWTISDTSVINSTSDIGRFSGVSSGKTTLTLSNKLTGYTKSFTIACGTIREGTYMVLNKDTGRYMDVEGPSYNSGAYIQQWDYHTGNQEKWEVTLLANGDYIIESLYSHKYLRVENGSTSANAKIIQYSDYNWTSCRWKIEDTASGAYKIIPMLVSSFAVSVPLNTNSNGTDLVQLQYSNDSNYRDEWIFDNIGEIHGIDNGSVYTIEAVHSGKVITANAGGESNGTNVCQQSLTPGYQWQRWKMLYQGNGEYKIQDMQSGKLLSISASSATSGANAHIWADDGTTGQFFKIKENVDGSYAFLSKCSYYTLALTVENNSFIDEANIYQYYNSGTGNQKYNIHKSNKGIIIVPGFGGSVLQKGGSFPGYSVSGNNDLFSNNRLQMITNVWTAIKDDVSNLLSAAGNVNCIFDIPSFINQFTSGINYQPYEDGIESAILLLTLLCDSNGDSYYDIVPKPFKMTESGDDKYGFDNTYGHLFTSLQEYISGHGDWSNYDLTFFSYDWRLPCSDSADALDAYISQMGYDNVVLLCHSMGGLVGSGYMAIGTNQRESVERFISFGTPYWGAVLAPSICLTGCIEPFLGQYVPGTTTLLEDTFHSLITNVVVKNVISNFQSVYELFPTEEYILDSGGYLTYEGNLCTTYSSTKNVFANHMKGYKSGLMNSAESFHNSLYIGTQHITSFTNCLYVYSSFYETVKWISYDPFLFGLLFEYSYSWNSTGDSIVPMNSATMSASSNIWQITGSNSSHMGLIDPHPYPDELSSILN